MMTVGTEFQMPDLAALLNPVTPDAGLDLDDDGPCTRYGAAFPSWSECRVFPGLPGQVASARRFIARVLARCPAAADAVLLTSELVTNTLQHTATGTGGDFEVIACHSPAGVRVTVTDEGSRTAPALVPYATLATSGRGIALVEALAARWGHQGSERGRAVWFELDCP